MVKRVYSFGHLEAIRDFAEPYFAERGTIQGAIDRSKRTFFGRYRLNEDDAFDIEVYRSQIRQALHVITRRMVRSRVIWATTSLEGVWE